MTESVVGAVASHLQGPTTAASAVAAAEGAAATQPAAADADEAATIPFADPRDCYIDVVADAAEEAELAAALAAVSAIPTDDLTAESFSLGPLLSARGYTSNPVLVALKVGVSLKSGVIMGTVVTTRCSVAPAVSLCVYRIRIRCCVHAFRRLVDLHWQIACDHRHGGGPVGRRQGLWAGHPAITRGLHHQDGRGGHFTSNLSM
jgi:hypothetical protein